MPKLGVEIIRHPTLTTTHWIGIITTRKQLCYFLAWADRKPTEEEVRQAWREAKNDFLPYTSGWR